MADLGSVSTFVLFHGSVSAQVCRSIFPELKARETTGHEYIQCLVIIIIGYILITQSMIIYFSQYVLVVHQHSKVIFHCT